MTRPGDRNPFLPAEEKLREEFVRLSELPPDAVMKLHLCHGRGETFEHLESELASQGHRRFALIAVSEVGVLLETTCGQLLHLRPNNKRFLSGTETPEGGERALIHEMLQSIADRPHVAADAKVAFYEVLPKVNTQVTPRDADVFRRHIDLKLGYTLQDADSSKGDLGYLPDGTVIAVDRHAVLVSDPAYRTAGTTDNFWLKSDSPQKQSRFDYLQTGISKQEHFFPAIFDGRVRGILSDRDIERMRFGELAEVRAEKPECFVSGLDEPGVLEKFIQLVHDDGWYPTQAHAILREQNLLPPLPPTTRPGSPASR